MALPVSAAMALPLLPAASSSASAPAPATETDASQTPSALFEEVAFAEAKRTGKRVEILDRRQEATEFFANPDGSMTRRSYGVPKWTRYDGMWRRTDPSLVRLADGSVGPAAPTFSIAFSGGGAQPLATMAKNGKKLSLTWPTPLPAPTVEGDTAIYRSVLPGVDLKLIAEVDGFAQHLVVHNAEAAANPALRTIKLGFKTDGVTLTEGPDNTLLAKDDKGATVFSAPGAKMWEQPAAAPEEKPTAAKSKAKAPSATGTDTTPDQPASAPVAADVSGSTLTLTPDAKLLATADQFPLVIDPVFDDGYRESWAVIYDATPNASYPNGSGWNSSTPADEPRVGYNGDGNTRSFFAMNTNGLAGATITDATFAVIQTHTWTCNVSDAGPTELWSAGGIANAPTWGNQEAYWGSKLDSDSFAGGNDTYCADDLGHDFKSTALTNYVQQAANGGWGTLVFGLRTPSLGNSNTFKRFRNNPVLEVDYNYKPVVTSKSAYEGYYVESGEGNVPVACGGRIGNSGITLNAKIKDQDGGNVTAYFTVKNSSGTAVTLSPNYDTVNGSGEASVLVPATKLGNGTYTWSVYAKDNENTTSAATPACSFSVDLVGPNKPVTVLDADGTKAGQATDSYVARVPRQFKFTNTVSDVDGYCWAMDRPLSAVKAPRCPNGTWVDAGKDANHTATVTITPFAHPVAKLNVVAYDTFGNRSVLAGGDDQVSLTTTEPSYVYEKENSDPTIGSAKHDRPGDLNGDGFADFVATDPDGQLWFYPGNGTLSPMGTRQNAGTGGWSGALIAHRGDLKGMSSKDSAPDGYEDFLVRLSDDKLYVYPGNGVGSPWYYTRKELAHPSQGSDWSGLRQMLLPGDIDGKPGNDLITVECLYDANKNCVNARLILYSGLAIGGGGQDQTKPFDWGRPVVLGTGGWRDLTNLAVEDVNGDAYADLVARDPADGKLYLYPGCVNDPEKCPNSGYKLLPRSVYGTGGWNQRPFLTSPGNTQGTLQNATVTTQPSPDLPPGPGNEAKTYTFKRFIPTIGQEAGDFWATTPADPDTPVTYVDSDGNWTSRLCPSGCLLTYPGTPTAHGAPRLTGTAGWATAVTGIF